MIKLLQHIVILLLICVVLPCNLCMAQPTTANYVKTTTHTSFPTTTTITDILYYDGLGRPIQQVQKDASPSGNDFVFLIEHDCNGRDSIIWNSAVIDEADSITPKNTVITASQASNCDTAPFTSIIYEQSPLGRPINQTAPGQSWHTLNKSVNTEYLFNNSTDRKCFHYKTTDNGNSFTIDRIYSTGELDVIRLTDEDSTIVYQFTDLHGRLILTREQDAAGSVVRNTYYVYDNRGNLCFVLPPMAAAELTSTGQNWNISNSIVDKFCFCYKYNSKNQCIYKKRPGCEYELIYYDKAGRMVATQDGNQRLDQKWLIHLYDQYGRETVNALSTNFPTGIENTIVQTTPVTDGLGFTANIDVSTSEVLSVNYYDGYNFLSNFTSVKDSIKYRTKAGFDIAWDNGSGNGAVSSRGMLTGTATRVLDTDTLLLRTIYYDYHENVIQTHEQNLKGGYEHYYYDLSFTGKPLKICHEHTTADTTTVETTAFTYDNMERLLTVTVTQGNEAPQLLCSNTYDELGRLASQGLGGLSQGATSAFAHQAGYTYNVRGWITGITGQQFSQTLHYEDPGSTGATHRFNGNISAMEWTAREALIAGDPVTQCYAYSYDGMNRLTSAAYATHGAAGINGTLSVFGTRNYSCTYEYDLNSNIKLITRQGVSLTTPVFQYTGWFFDFIDNLLLTYDGNQLKNVTDQCDALTYEGAMDFRDGANTRIEYTWDDNGNMTSDKNRKIHKISYNILNLPNSITFNDGNIIRHTYAADGRRLRTEYLLSNMQIMEREGVGDELTPMSGDIAGEDISGFVGPGIPIDPINPIDDNRVVTLMVRDYCGNHVYRNDSVERVLNDYGYWSDTGYHYYVKDYQGNVRAVIDGSGMLEEINSYYPYGALMGGSAAAGIQPYKYGGKDLDRQAGIDWYDSQARWYDSLIGRTPTQDRLAEKYYHLSPYVWCAGNPVLNIDLDGRFWETIWDVGNVIYDVGAALYHHATGNHEAARGNWMDAGADAFATVLPIVPAGATKAVKAGTKITKGIEKASDTKKTLKHANEIKEGREFEKAELNKAIKRGENVSSNARLVPQNGKGNIKGNRTDVDQLIKHDDGTYTIVETKRTASTPLSKGQKEAKMNVEESFGIFEIRTNIPEQNLKKGEKINIIKYRRINKYNN